MANEERSAPNRPLSSRISRRNVPADEVNGSSLLAVVNVPDLAKKVCDTIPKGCQPLARG